MSTRDRAGAAKQVDVQRLALRVNGMEPLDAQALAQAVALRLAHGLALAPGEGALQRLHVEVRPRAGETPAGLADRTAAQVAAELVRVAATEAGQ